MIVLRVIAAGARVLCGYPVALSSLGGRCFACFTDMETGPDWKMCLLGRSSVEACWEAGWPACWPGGHVLSPGPARNTRDPVAREWAKLCSRGRPALLQGLSQLPAVGTGRSLRGRRPLIWAISCQWRACLPLFLLQPQANRSGRKARETGWPGLGSQGCGLSFPRDSYRCPSHLQLSVGA